MRGGAAGSVVASTADAITTSGELELVLLPPGNHAGKDGAAAQVDRMTSSGHVEVSSQGRRGTGEKLVYSSDTGNYVLTGTAEAPPRIKDPVRGTVTGEALVFNSRDDSVSYRGRWTQDHNHYHGAGSAPARVALNSQLSPDSIRPERDLSGTLFEWTGSRLHQCTTTVTDAVERPNWFVAFRV